MNKAVFQYAVLFFVLLLAQVLVCNHIALFNVAVPMIFIYFIIRLPIALNTSLLLTLSFLMGLSVDLFSDTAGVNALACCLIAVMKRPILYAYVPRDDRTKDIVPSVTSLGTAVFSKFTLTVTAVYCFMTFSIEFFSFADIQDILIMTGASCLLTFLLLVAIDSLVRIRG